MLEEIGCVGSSAAEEQQRAAEEEKSAVPRRSTRSISAADDEQVRRSITRAAEASRRPQVSITRAGCCAQKKTVFTNYSLERAPKPGRGAKHSSPLNLEVSGSVFRRPLLLRLLLLRVLLLRQQLVLLLLLLLLLLLFLL